MSISRKDVLKKIPKGKSQIPSVPSREILDYVYGGKALPTTITDALDVLDKESRRLYRLQGYLNAPTSGSLNNCHGRWSESLFAIQAWNTLANINKSSKKDIFIYAKLPAKNVKKGSGSDWLTILNKTCAKKIEEFERDKTDRYVAKTDHNRFTLIASNPDAVILRFSKNNIANLSLPLDPCSPLSSSSVANLQCLDEIFGCFEKTVTPSENLVAFVSMKVSTRSDRRYQFLDEGNHVKSVLMFLKDRKADKDLTTEFLSNRYFAFCLSDVSKEDQEVMDCAMSACISSPVLDPVWSVDKLYEAKAFSDIDISIKDILKKAVI